MVGRKVAGWRGVDGVLSPSCCPTWSYRSDWSDSQLDFSLIFLLTDLELQTEIEDSDKGADMFVITIFWKATFDGR